MITFGVINDDDEGEKYLVEVESCHGGVGVLVIIGIDIEVIWPLEGHVPSNHSIEFILSANTNL